MWFDEPPMKHDSTQRNTTFLREAAPYIHHHRGKTFIVAFAGEIITASLFHQIIQDLAIISSLGVKLVLVHGTRPQIDERLRQKNTPIHLHDGIRITDHKALLAAQEAVGFLGIRIESLLAYALNQPTISTDSLSVISGNFITARPFGIHAGIDYGYTGRVRRIHHQNIQQQLDRHNIVLLSPIGYSPTGETYNLHYEEVAIAAAKSLKADKLMFLSHQPLNLPRELTLDEAKTHASQIALLTPLISALETGVDRIHLLDADIDGALLLELYTRDGVGTMIAAEQFESLRKADIEDISGILNLIRPLENTGMLIKRSREQLELEIGNFHIITRDQQIIACTALYDTDNPQLGELACFVVHPHYRGGRRGDMLLKHITQLAQTQHKNRLLVLTTQTADWFRERGFRKGTVEALPANKKSLYNYQRNSQILFKDLANPNSQNPSESKTRFATNDQESTC